LGARIDTLVKALVAVPSRLFASAAAVGCKVPPAPDTLTGVVGLKFRMPPAPAPVPELAVVLAVVTLAVVLTVTLAEVLVPAAAPRLAAGFVVALDPTEVEEAISDPDPESETVTVRVRGVQLVPEFVVLAAAALVAAAAEAVVTAVVVLADDVEVLLFPLPAGGADAPPPKVKDWLGSAVLHLAMSMTLPLTTRQEPAAFPGWRARGPAEPVNANSWEFVTAPPTSC
jgi:hypothetical protein